MTVASSLPYPILPLLTLIIVLGDNIIQPDAYDVSSLKASYRACQT